MLRPMTYAPRGRINQLWAVRSASSVTSPRCHSWTCLPPTPSGFSRLWLGPAAKPSSEMDMWQVVKVMASKTDTSRETHRRGSYSQADGAIAQLGERVLCKHEVAGSIPAGSTPPRSARRLLANRRVRHDPD